MKRGQIIHPLSDDRSSGQSDNFVHSRVSLMFSGAISSSVAIFITHPLDVIKLNLQAKPLTTKEIITYHYVLNKGVTRIYRGIGASMARSWVHCSMRFELYEMAKRKQLLNSFYKKIIVAGMTGAIGGFFVTPMVKVHVRTQNDQLLAPEERRYYKGLFNGLNRIYREEGLRMMFAGSNISSIRGMMITIGQIAFYDELKIRLQSNSYFKDDFTTYLLSSMIAGFVATLLQQPFEVVLVKSVIVAPNKFKTSIEIVKEINRKHGLFGFYKGLVFGFMRIIPQTVITYMMLETLRKNFVKALPATIFVNTLETTHEAEDKSQIEEKDVILDPENLEKKS